MTLYIVILVALVVGALWSIASLFLPPPSTDASLGDSARRQAAQDEEDNMPRRKAGPK